MENITKSATITAINKDIISLKIKSCSACSSCSVKNYCSLNEVKERVIQLHNKNNQKLVIGEEVNIVMNTKQGFKAVIFSYVVPLVLLLLTLITSLSLGYNDFISGISAIIILIPYYFGVFLCRNKIKSDFKFKISKKDAIKND